MLLYGKQHRLLVKQEENNISLLILEAKYIDASQQKIWMKHVIEEYGLKQDEMVIYCKNMSVINISKNPIQHFRTKRIEIWHHILRELVEKELVLRHVPTERQKVNIFTKALGVQLFENLKSEMDLCIMP